MIGPVRQRDAAELRADMQSVLGLGADVLVIRADELLPLLERQAHAAQPGGGVMPALSIRTEPTEHGLRIVFSGGRGGRHSLDLASTTPERARAHAEGYAETSGFNAFDANVFGQLAAERTAEWHAQNRRAA